MQISPDVYRIEGIRGSNCYLITVPELVLIDTGMPGQAGKILNFMARLGYDGRGLQRIILTHHDVDHIGSAAELQQLTGAEVCMHPADADCVLRRTPRRPRWKAWGSALAEAWSRFQPPRITHLVHDGETIGPIRVIHTPGHSVGSISLKYGSVLFVGALVQSRFYLRENFPLVNEDNAQVRASIKKIAGLDFEVLCPGHGKIIPRGVERLRDLAACWT